MGPRHRLRGPVNAPNKRNWSRGATVYQPAYVVGKEFKLASTPGYGDVGSAISSASDWVVLNAAKGVIDPRGVPVVVSTYHNRIVAKFDTGRERWMLSWGTGVPACSCNHRTEPAYNIDTDRRWEHEPYCVLAPIEFATAQMFPLAAKGKFFHIALQKVMDDMIHRSSERNTHDGRWTIQFTHLWAILGYMSSHQYPYQWGMVELYEPPTP